MPGPYAHRQALDEVQMMGGLAYMTGPSSFTAAGRRFVTDILSGGFGVIGILAALHQRERTGLGQQVQALFESVAFMGHTYGRCRRDRTVPPPMPERGVPGRFTSCLTPAMGTRLFLA